VDIDYHANEERFVFTKVDGLLTEVSMKNFVNDTAEIARRIGDHMTLFSSIDPVAGGFVPGCRQLCRSGGPAAAPSMVRQMKIAVPSVAGATVSSEVTVMQGVVQPAFAACLSSVSRRYVSAAAVASSMVL
jgi:hypothetical protein